MKQQIKGAAILAGLFTITMLIALTLLGGCAHLGASSAGGVLPPHPTHPPTAFHVAWTVLVVLCALSVILALVYGWQTGKWGQGIAGACLALFLSSLSQFFVNYEKPLVIGAGLIFLSMLALAIFEAWKNRRDLIQAGESLLHLKVNQPAAMASINHLLPDSLAQQLSSVPSSSPSGSGS